MSYLLHVLDKGEKVSQVTAMTGFQMEILLTLP